MKTYNWDNYLNELVNDNKYTFTLSALKNIFSCQINRYCRACITTKKTKKSSKFAKNFTAYYFLTFLIMGKYLILSF